MNAVSVIQAISKITVVNIAGIVVHLPNKLTPLNTSTQKNTPYVQFESSC